MPQRRGLGQPEHIPPLYYGTLQLVFAAFFRGFYAQLFEFAI